MNYKKEEIYVGYIHSVKDYYNNPSIKDKKAYFEKLTFIKEKRKVLTIYRDILTSVLYMSEEDIGNITFNTKYVVNLRKLKKN